MNQLGELRCAVTPWIGMLLLSLTCVWPCHADVPEPDYILYGTIVFGNTPVTAQQTNIIVEARQVAAGPVVASYQMGSVATCGNFYSIRLPLEAFLPLSESGSSRVGGMVYLTVRDSSGVRLQKSTSIASRGKLVRMDFIELDGDGDGLPDSWEQRYFGNATAGNASADSDGDGRSNLAEFLDGTNPLIADGRHPADLAPADDLLTATEVNNYALAWQTGAAWSKEPTNIPISYVTRAASLQVAGGRYGFTNLPPTNAPMWWVKVSTNAAPIIGTNYVVSSFPSTILNSQPLLVSVSVTPDTNVQAQAVEDQIPAGWIVGDISHGGSYDPVNRKVKWGPFYDSGTRDLFYELAIPTNTSGFFSFSGIGSFDGLNTAITGSRGVSVSAPGAPSFTSSDRDGIGPKFTLLGIASQVYTIEVSTTLTNWTTLTNVTTDTNGQCLFRPPSPTGTGCKFYRARTGP